MDVQSTGDCACSLVARGSWSDLQCSAIRPSALQFASRCVDPSKINCTPSPDGAMQSSTWVHAARPTGAVQSKVWVQATRHPVPSPPLHVRSVQSRHRWVLFILSSEFYNEQLLSLTVLPHNAVQQGGGCSAALTVVRVHRRGRYRLPRRALLGITFFIIWLFSFFYCAIHLLPFVCRSIFLTCMNHVTL